MYLFEEHKNKSWCDYYVTEEVEPFEVSYTFDVPYGKTRSPRTLQESGNMCYITLTNSNNQHKIVFLLYDRVLKYPPVLQVESMNLYIFDYENSISFKNEQDSISNILNKDNLIATSDTDCNISNGIRIETTTAHPKIFYSIGNSFNLNVLRTFITMLQQNMNQFLSGNIGISGGEDSIPYMVNDVSNNFKSPDLFIYNMIQYVQKNFSDSDKAINNIKSIFPKYLEDYDTMDPSQDDSELF